MTSNFYKVKCFPEEIIHYDVAISDGIADDKFPKKLNHSVIRNLVTPNQNIFKKKLHVYDGKKSLYFKEELPFESQVSVNNTSRNI